MLEDKDLLSIQEVRTKVEKAFAAWQKYRTYSQEQVDAIVERMAAAARANAKRLADLAVEETGYGNAKDKYIKNLLNCDWLPRRMRGIKTVGILRELPDEKIVEIGVPMEPVVSTSALPTGYSRRRRPETRRTTARSRPSGGKSANSTFSRISRGAPPPVAPARASVPTRVNAPDLFAPSTTATSPDGATARTSAPFNPKGRES